MQTYVTKIALATVLILATSATTAMAQQRPQVSQFGWSTNYRQALESAKRSNKPVMVLFRCVP